MIMYKLTTEDDENYYTDVFTDLILDNILHYQGKEGIINLAVHLVNVKKEELEEYEFVPQFKCYTLTKEK